MSRAQHDRARKIVRENFNHSMLPAFRDPMKKVLDELCSSLDQSVGPDGRMGEVVDISQKIALTMFRILTLFAFGTDMEVSERKRFSELIDVLFEEVLIEIVEYPLRQYLEPFGTRKRLYKARTEIRAMLGRIVEKRATESKTEREARSPDLIDALIKVGDGDLGIAMSVLMEFSFGGAHTTTQMLVWAIYDLSVNKKTAMRLAEEVDTVLKGRKLEDKTNESDLEQMVFLDAVWKETCRLHSANPGTMRVAARDVKLVGTGTKIAKGTQVMAFSAASQLDERFWRAPGEFRPERWGRRGEGERVVPGAYVPFGIGSVSCPGRFLADYEGKAVLAECMRRFRFELGCRREEVKICSFFVDSARVASKEGGELDMGLPVRLERRLVF